MQQLAHTAREPRSSPGLRYHAQRRNERTFCRCLQGSRALRRSPGSDGTAGFHMSLGFHVLRFTACNCWEADFFYKSNFQIQMPSLSQRSRSLIKPLLKNSFSTIFQGPGPGEAPSHFSRFVCWVHYCSKLCQSSSWKPRREASLSKSKPLHIPQLLQLL